MDVVVLIPMLGRPTSVGPLLASLRESLDDGQKARPVFLVSQSDREVGIAVRTYRADHLVCKWRPDRADFALKVNYGYRETTEEFLMLGASDLVFQPGWLTAALDIFETRDVGVVGTNDLSPRGRRGRHATHPVVCRGYIEMWGGTCDATGDIYCELYDHQYVDDELRETASARGCWAFATNSIVEHRHPNWGNAEMDATYEKALRSTVEDRQLFQSRRRKWNGRAPTGVRARAFR